MEKLAVITTEICFHWRIIWKVIYRNVHGRVENNEDARNTIWDESTGRYVYNFMLASVHPWNGNQPSITLIAGSALTTSLSLFAFQLFYQNRCSSDGRVFLGTLQFVFI